MSSFAIDLGEEKSYSLIALRGGSAQIIDKKQLAISNWQLAGQNENPGLGLGLGGPWVTQAWPKGQPSVAQGSSLGEIE
jgi:hypothetical protein